MHAQQVTPPINIWIGRESSCYQLLKLYTLICRQS